MERYIDHFREEHLDLLMQKKLFYGMSHEEIRAFIFHAKPLYVILYEGQSLRLDNEYSQMIGIVLTGTTHIYSVGYDGNRTLVRSMEEGEAGGVLYSLLDYRNRLLEFVAYSDAELIMFSPDAVFQTEESVVVSQQKMLVNIINCQRSTFFDMTEHIAIVSQRTVRGKIMRFLHYYAQLEQSSEFTLPFSREGLADYLAVDRASLSRSLGELRREGVIDFERSRFRLLTEDKLHC